MIEEDRLPVKNFFAWFFCIIGGLAAAYIAFLSFISIWVGFSHLGRSGFWVPILAGTIILVLVSWLYFRATRAVFRHPKEESLINSFS
jgi:CBS-domain-containing membrane protein